MLEKLKLAKVLCDLNTEIERLKLLNQGSFPSFSKMKELEQFFSPLIKKQHKQIKDSGGCIITHSVDLTISMNVAGSSIDELEKKITEKAFSDIKEDCMSVAIMEQKNGLFRVIILADIDHLSDVCNVLNENLPTNSKINEEMFIALGASNCYCYGLDTVEDGLKFINENKKAKECVVESSFSMH